MCHFFPCLIVISICDIDMVIILIDSLTCLSILICSCHNYPAHFDMYAHIVVYLVCLSIDSLACTLS